MNIPILLICLPMVLTFDCNEICNVTITVMENSPVNVLKWNLIDLLFNRTSSAVNLQFSLSDPSEYFQLTTSILTFRAKELDREKLCEKNDLCPLSLQIFTQTSLIVIFRMIVIDENDWKPRFEQDYLHLTIRENLPNNFRVQLPLASDYDSMEYDIDHYEFVNQTDDIDGRFQLEKSADELRLKLLQRLDCETKDNYQLYIIAVDKGGWKSNILHVNITVGDVNEYQPRFSRRLYHAHLPEDLLPSSPVLQILATDDDCSDQIVHYSILNPHTTKNRFPFEIESTTGVVRVTHPLDYETISTYRFRVKASNLDQITSSIVPVIIDVLDVNDNQPSIQMNILNEYRVYRNNDTMMNIRESTSVGQVIGSVLIRDGDSAMINHRLSLKILSCVPSTSLCPIELYSGLESAPTTYLIRTTRELDNERGDETFLIIFESSDYGDPILSSQRRLIVNIEDENDCAPRFTRDDYQFRLDYLSPIGSRIGQVQAMDADYSPDFRLIQYKLLETDSSDLCHLDPNNGSLFLAKRLSAGMKVNLTVIAMDQHNHSLYDHASVHIRFIDQATCSPRIYMFNTTEHQRTPYKLGQINMDDCSQLSTPISLRLFETNSSLLPFTVDTKTGTIEVIEELDREIKSFYRFHLIHQQSIELEIHVHILDDNDHYPIFDRLHPEYVYVSLDSIKENNRLLITHLHANDADVDSNGLVNYYFVNRDHYRYFHLYSNGSIFLYNSQDVRLPICLEVYARDEGHPTPRNSNGSVVIHVCDVNKPNECSSKKLSKTSHLARIFPIVFLLLFIASIILCITWTLLIKKTSKRNENIQAFDCPIEGTKNLIVGDSVYDFSAIINDHRWLKSADV